MIDLVSIIENEGKVLHEIRQYLLSKGIEDESFIQKLNDIFEQSYKDKKL